MERRYRQSIRFMAGLTCLLGIAMVVTTIARGGGPFATGVLLGVLLAAAGAGRILLDRSPREGGA